MLIILFSNFIKFYTTKNRENYFKNHFAGLFINKIGMYSLRDMYLSILSGQDENFFQLDADSVGSIEDIHLDKAENYIKLDIMTTYGKPASLVTSYEGFKKWYEQKKSEYPANSKELYKGYAIDYLNDAKVEQPQEDEINEIIDADGNLEKNTDMPNNSTGTMIGKGLNFDLEKVYRSLPKSIRYSSGGYGSGGGSPTW